MENKSLEYRLLHPSQPVDPRTQVTIIYSVDRLAALIDHFDQQNKPKRIIVDNVAASMAMPDLKTITTVGYVPRGDALYLYSPTSDFVQVPLKTPLEDMTSEDVQALAMLESYVSINPQMYVALRDYALEEP